MGGILSRFRWKRSDSDSGVSIDKADQPIQVKTVEVPVTKTSDVPKHSPHEKTDPSQHKQDSNISKSVASQPIHKQEVLNKSEEQEKKVQVILPTAKPPPERKTEFVRTEPENVKVSTLQVELQPKPSTPPISESTLQRLDQLASLSPAETVKEGVKKVETVKEEITPTGRIVTQEVITTTVTEKQSVNVRKDVIQPPQKSTPVAIPQQEEEEEVEEEEEEYEEEEEEEDEDIYDIEDLQVIQDDKNVEKAAVTIQAGIRGYLTRKALNQQKQEADRNKDEPFEDTIVPDQLSQSVSFTTPSSEGSSQTVKEVAATVVENVIKLATQEIPEVGGTDLLISESKTRSKDLTNENIKDQKASAENEMQIGIDGVMEFEEELSTDGDEDENFDVAATKIQASYRGYKVRRELKDKHGFDGPNKIENEENVNNVQMLLSEDGKTQLEPQLGKKSDELESSLPISQPVISVDKMIIPETSSNVDQSITSTKSEDTLFSIAKETLLSELDQNSEVPNVHPTVSEVLAISELPTLKECLEKAEKNLSDDKDSATEIGIIIDEDNDFLNTKVSEENNDFKADLTDWVISEAYDFTALPQNGTELNKEQKEKLNQSEEHHKTTEQTVSQPLEDNLLLNFQENTDFDATSSNQQKQEQAPSYWLMGSDVASNQQDNLLSFLGDTHPSLEVGNKNLPDQDLMGEEILFSSQAAFLESQQSKEKNKDECPSVEKWPAI